MAGRRREEGVGSGRHWEESAGAGRWRGKGLSGLGGSGRRDRTEGREVLSGTGFIGSFGEITGVGERSETKGEG
jgi:hypothetical protein